MTALLTETAHVLSARLGEQLILRARERPGRQILRDLAWSTDALAGITLSAWTWVGEMLEEEGFEGRELAQHCQVLLEGIDGVLAGYERLLALAEAAGLTREAAGLHELEIKLPALREARPKVVGALCLATRPARPVDEATLAESRTAIEHGGFVNLNDEYLARLRANEDF